MADNSLAFHCAKQNTQIILPSIQNTGDLYRLVLNTVEQKIVPAEQRPQISLVTDFG